MPKVNFTFQLEPETYDRLTEISESQRVSKSALARQFVNEGVKRAEQERDHNAENARV